MRTTQHALVSECGQHPKYAHATLTSSCVAQPEPSAVCTSKWAASEAPLMCAQCAERMTQFFGKVRQITAHRAKFSAPRLASMHHVLRYIPGFIQSWIRKHSCTISPANNILSLLLVMLNGAPVAERFLRKFGQKTTSGDFLLRKHNLQREKYPEFLANRNRYENF